MSVVIPAASTGQSGIRRRVSGLRFVVRALRGVAKELRIWLADLGGRIGARNFAQAGGLKLHVGCGPKLKQGRVNIDLVPQADLKLDLRRPLPFREGSCATVYSEHFLEHLDYPDDAMSFLRECRRVLQAGGRLSVGVPDAVAPLPYMLADIAAGRKEVARQVYHPEWCRTPMEQTNFLFRQNYIYWLHEHRFAYDYDTLAKCLGQAGFREIRRRDFDAAWDSEERRNGTLYVEAVK